MYQHRKDTLLNGLRVVTVEVPHLHSALVAAYVRVGSRHERPETNGVSHFLEHLLFRGCARFPEGKRMNARVEDAGGSLNGITARDFGYYYTPIHPSRLPVGIETLGAMVTSPLLKEVEIEREVILEEMLDEVDEEGRDIDIDNVAKRAAFGEHSLAYKIAGTSESVAALTRDQLLEHHRRFYGGRNMVLVAAGPLRHEQVLELASHHFAGLPPLERNVDAAPPPWPRGPTFVHVEHEESQVDLRLTFPVPPEMHPDFASVMVLRRILDDGLSSRLQVNIVDRKGLAYSVAAGVDAFSELGTFEVDLSCAPAKLPAACAELLRILGELCEREVEEEELERARLRHRIGLEFALDSPGDLAGWFGGTALFHEPEEFSARIARVDAVTAADVRRVARRAFRRENLVVTAVGSPSVLVLSELQTLVRDAADLPE